MERQSAGIIGDWRRRRKRPSNCQFDSTSNFGVRWLGTAFFGVVQSRVTTYDKVHRPVGVSEAPLATQPSAGQLRNCNGIEELHKSGAKPGFVSEGGVVG